MTQPASDPMDMGADGQLVAKDAYGFTLHYFDEGNNHDYAAIGSTQPVVNKMPSGFTSLYNGNIAAMNINVPKIGQPVLHSYKYDQLNRIKQVNNFNNYDAANNTWQATQQHKEALTFDANGNIQTALLNGNNAQLTYENFNYNYDPVKKNRLLSITNTVNSTTSNYQYDEAGNVTKDELEGNAEMDWNVYGKLSRVVKDDGTEILFKYDAAGNRIGKIIGAKEEWTVRDASGNIMATYLKDPSVNNGKLSTESYYMYGSSMLGAWNHVTNMETTSSSQAIVTFRRSEKNYYLGNQLNNNLVVLSDSKRGFDDNSDGVIDRYEVDVLSATDYSAYGENLKGREFNGSGIKFGFNNKWNDFETGYQDYGMRMYSKRRRGFVSVDPITSKYPMLSPYQFASNSPLSGIDLDGLEYLRANVARIEVYRGYVYLKMSNMHNVTQNTYNAANANSNFWSYGPNGKKGIGISLQIGSTDFGLLAPKFNPEILNATDNSFGAPDVNFQPGKISIEKGTAASTGVPDRRLKDREVSSASPAGARGLAKASLAIDALIVGSSLLQEYQVNEDIGLAKEHYKIFQMAEYDVRYALKNSKLIPREYQTEERLSDITNVVLSGVSKLNDKKILEIGEDIYNEFSKRREKYDGTMKITGPDGMEIKSIPKVNPIYNPNYGNEPLN